MLATLALLSVLLGYHSPEVRTTAVAGMRVTVVRAKLSDVRMKVGLAKGRVGAAEDLMGIAKRYGAAAAIDGCYFDAYSGKAIRNPYHNIITDGALAHIGNTGPTIGFEDDGRGRVERVELGIEGLVWGRDGKPRSFYAYRANHLPEGANTATLFTSRFGSRTPVAGLQIVFDQGRVTWTGQGPCDIPARGGVFLFTGADATLANRFHVGDQLSYGMVLKKGDAEVWKRVTEAIGCGPTLVRGGRVACDPASEGFSDPKVLRASAARSAVGLTSEGEVVFVVGQGTVYQMAKAMKGLGCSDAMCMDCGASSGLWAQGKYVRRPGRNLPNALLICPK